MTPARRREIRALLDAATPGPWQWFGNTAVKSIYLATVHHGRRFVMQFERWGMRDACPSFQVPISPNNGMMVRADTMVKYERPYRKDVDGIDHPDARLIEQAPALIHELLTAADDDAAELARLREIERCAREFLTVYDDSDVILFDRYTPPLRAALTPPRTDPPAAWNGDIPHEPNEDK